MSTPDDRARAVVIAAVVTVADVAVADVAIADVAIADDPTVAAPSAVALRATESEGRAPSSRASSSHVGGRGVAQPTSPGVPNATPAQAATTAARGDERRRTGGGYPHGRAKAHGLPGRGCRLRHANDAVTLSGDAVRGRRPGTPSGDAVRKCQREPCGRGCRQRPSSDTLRPMRVLIVDDSAAARAQARYAVEEAGLGDGPLVVTEALDGVDALRHLAATDVDLLVVDLHMPHLHGLELLSFWRQRAQQGSRAVVVSTDVSPADRQKARGHGAVAFCDKPISPEGLRAALASLSG
jgi:two-component system chemotaxis response regulator CheY